MDLKDYEYKKILKDVRYRRDDYELKKDMSSSLENLFNDALEEFLNKNNELKKEWSAFLNIKTKKLDQAIQTKIEELYSKVDNIDDIDNIEPIDDIHNKELTPEEVEMKRIYRDIVKKTHPDKLNSDAKYTEKEKEKRIELYKKASVYYDKKDFVNMMYCADELDINYNATFLNIETLKKDIDVYKDKSDMCEKSIYWKWYKDGKTETSLKDLINKMMGL